MAKRSSKPATAAHVTPPGVVTEPTTRTLAAPVFAQPEPTDDPSTFKIKHPSDTAAYRLIDELNKEHKHDGRTPAVRRLQAI